MKGEDGADGQELTEKVWEKDFYATENKRIPTAMGEFREKLKTYYAGDGHKDPLTVEIAANPYRLVFRSVPQPPPPDPQPPPPDPQPPPPIWLWIICFHVVAATIGLWKYYIRPCTNYVSVVAPPKNEVSMKNPVSTKRTQTQRFCRCRDYVVVQPVDQTASWFVVNQLSNGDHPNRNCHIRRFENGAARSVQYIRFDL